MPKRQSKKREAIVRRFAVRLREIRLQCGMTQAELARRAKVSVTYVSQLESADAAPGIDLVDRLARALGAAAADLLPAAEPPDNLAVLQEQAQRLFQELHRAADRETYLLLNPFLAHLVEAAAKRQ
jgi:transcriptional regulator with XRE-family HTH domain